MCTIPLHRDLTPDESRQRKCVFKKPFCWSCSQQSRGWKVQSVLAPLSRAAQMRTLRQSSRLLCAHSPHPPQHRSDKYHTVIHLKTGSEFLSAQAGNDHVCCYNSLSRCCDFCLLKHKLCDLICSSCCLFHVSIYCATIYNLRCYTPPPLALHHS